MGTVVALTLAFATIVAPAHLAAQALSQSQTAIPKAEAVTANNGMVVAQEARAAHGGNLRKRQLNLLGRHAKATRLGKDDGVGRERDAGVVRETDTSRIANGTRPSGDNAAAVAAMT